MISLRSSQMELKPQDKLLRLIIDRARKDFPVFARLVFNWKVAPFQKAWHQLIDKHPRVLIEAPRDHGKTSQISIARTLWELGKNPNLRIKSICQSDDRAQEILRLIAQCIESNPRLRLVFPDLRPAFRGTWTRHKIFVKRDKISKDPSVEALGILSTVTGGRADLLIFDDPVDFRNAIYYPSLRKAVKQVYRAVWVNLLEPDGRIIYICTVWHQDDLTHELAKQTSVYKVLVQSIDQNFTPLWPEKWPKRKLKQRFLEIGEREFNRQFRNQAITDQEFLFPERILRPWYIKGFDGFDLQNAQKFIGLDLAIGKSRESSHTAFFVVALTPEGIKIPIAIEYGHFSSPDSARKLVELFQEYQPVSIFVENNAYQAALIEWLTELEEAKGLSLPIYSYTTGTQKASLVHGLPALALQVQQGKWRLPVLDHSKTCKCGFCTWHGELQAYPFGKFDDTVMAMWLASRACGTATKEYSIRWI